MKKTTIARWTMLLGMCTALGTVTVAEPPSTVCRDKVCFSTTVDLLGAPLDLRGVSTYRYWGFRVYTGAFYLPAGETSRAAALGETPRKLVLKYHRSVSVDQIVEKSLEVLEENPEVSIEKLRPLLTRLESLYVPVEQGDSYAITYDPTQGSLSLYFNERLLGQFTDRDFARAYFGIWVSNHSVSESFTDELLGRKDR